jgi:hypothetical protein
MVQRYFPFSIPCLDYLSILSKTEKRSVGDDEEKLSNTDTRMLQIQSKRFYLDVKQVGQVISPTTIAVLGLVG